MIIRHTLINFGQYFTKGPILEFLNVGEWKIINKAEKGEET